MNDVRAGRRLGVDVGRARIGIAVSDPHGMLATPVETIQRTDDATAVTRIVQLAREFDVVEAVVGLPLNLQGSSTASTDDARALAGLIAAQVPVRLVDERMSTVVAQSHLHASGRGGSGKRGRSQRQQIDQAAAVVILQGALDQLAHGSSPGDLLDAEGAS